MATVSVLRNLDEAQLASMLEKASEMLADNIREVVMDFSAVRRINASAIPAMEEFICVAEEKGITVVLLGVNVHVYKALKLVKLASRLSFRELNWMNSFEQK
ncbi:MAG TPA: STAS domain-containing protein [Terriglobales bacterium]|nr:STAS domain-containing protein [Terriglobales bacterium]